MEQLLHSTHPFERWWRVAKVLWTSYIQKQMQDHGWSLTQSSDHTVVFSDKNNELLSIPRHPTRSDLIYLSELTSRTPVLKLEFSEAAFEELPLEDVGLEVLIDQSHAEDTDTLAFLTALSNMNRAMGGAGLSFTAIEAITAPIPLHELEHEQAHENIGLIRYAGKPKLDSNKNAQNELRIFFLYSGYLLLHFAAITIEEWNKTPTFIHDWLKTLKLKLHMGDTFKFEVGHIPGEGEHSPTTDIDTITNQQELIQMSMQNVADTAGTIRDKGGAAVFLAPPLRQQLKHGRGEFADDLRITDVARKVAYRKLKGTDNLPSPPETALRIMKLTRDINVDISKLVEVFNADPAMALKILQYVNSPFFGLRNPATSIKSAIVSLGLNQTRSIVLSISIGTGRRTGSCCEFDYEMFWKESTARAIAARHIASSFKGGFSPDDAFAAGLLCQIGRLAFATVKPDEYAALLSRANLSDCKQLARLERQVLDIDHCELAGEMMAEWELPEYFSRAILYQRDVTNENVLPANSRERNLAMILSWTDTVWKAMTAEGTPIRSDLQEAVIHQAERLGIVHDEVENSFDTIVGEWKDVGNMFNVTPLPVPAWKVLTG